MRFIGLTEGLKVTKEKLPAVISVISVVLLCLLSFVGISALLEADAAAAMDRHEQEITDLIESSSQITDDLENAIESSKAESSETSALSEATTSSSFASSTESTEVTTTSGTTEPTTTTTTAATTTAATTTSATTRGTTETTVGEKTHNAIVYATKTVNLRTGPGTQYESLRLLHRGDQIDVIGVTTNGWYKTIKGNYVIASCTQSKKINTPTPTPKPATATPKPTKTPTKKPTKAPTPTNKPAPDKDKMTLVGDYTITFYIPFQGTKTASGTTCTMGRTIAASKNDFPFGTVLYIENDPLGGDGYYTVEDRGVSSGKIDIFVNSMKDVPSYGRTTRKVYIVNK